MIIFRNAGAGRVKSFNAFFSPFKYRPLPKSCTSRAGKRWGKGRTRDHLCKWSSSICGCNMVLRRSNVCCHFKKAQQLYPCLRMHNVTGPRTVTLFTLLTTEKWAKYKKLDFSTEFAKVEKLKADTSSLIPSSDRIKELWVLFGL